MHNSDPNRNFVLLLISAMANENCRENINRQHFVRDNVDLGNYRKPASNRKISQGGSRQNIFNNKAQNVGHHALPSKMASYLNLPNYKEYTGHSFRRTSATLLADSGADILALKKDMADGNLQISVGKKILGGHEAGRVSTIPNAEDLTGPVMIHYPQDEPGTSQTQVLRKNSPIIAVGQETFLEELHLSNLSKQGTSFTNYSVILRKISKNKQLSEYICSPRRVYTCSYMTHHNPYNKAVRCILQAWYENVKRVYEQIGKIHSEILSKVANLAKPKLDEEHTYMKKVDEAYFYH
ncbi:hypothetical protein NQ317_003727 [Molorchus minor]|uniref:Uncharacterized protein n=1 Tax=Molorchus minor TaxID=1323400 RepID=A0ABQ9IPT6_9CUCU|nr:hypothetical protein NQ317_003727 [Molorchus minor]